MNALLLTICITFISCASNPHDAQMELKRDYQINKLYPKDGTHYLIIEYPNIDEFYRERRIKKLINNDPELSCFESQDDKKKSFNYVEMISSEVSILRDFSIRQIQSISVLQRESLINGEYLNIRVEQKADKFSVRTKDCFNKIFDGKSVWVISEIYE